MKNIIFLLLIATSILTSCKSQNKSVISSNENLSSTPSFENNLAEINACGVNQNDRLIDFSFSLFDNIASVTPLKNTSVSPASLNIAIGMVYAGAMDKTAKEISSIIGFDSTKQSFFDNFSLYLNYLNSFSEDENFEFNLANRVFLEQSYSVLETYKENIKKYFSGAFQLADFVHNAEKEETNINSWVEKITKNRIKNLLPKGTLASNTSMVLVNALYFKSDWQYPFLKERTYEKDFFLTSSEKIKTEFMTQRIKSIKYCEIESYQVIEMTYKTKDVSLIFILPRNSSVENLSNLNLSGEQYRKILKSLKFEEVYIEIPKFKIESSFELSNMLKAMGINSAFADADFSGISGHKDLVISKVIQKTFFEVDEKGSEAAAATAIEMRLTSSYVQPELKITYDFIANRPFFYVLKENKFNTPLFIGQYVKP